MPSQCACWGYGDDERRERKDEDQNSNKSVGFRTRLSIQKGSQWKAWAEVSVGFIPIHWILRQVDRRPFPGTKATTPGRLLDGVGLGTSSDMRPKALWPGWMNYHQLVLPTSYIPGKMDSSEAEGAEPSKSSHPESGPR